MALSTTPNENDFDINEAQTVAIYANRVLLDRKAVHDLGLFTTTDETSFFDLLGQLVDRLAAWPGVNL